MILEQNYLEHHGIKGQKWGVRLYQKRDGSLTALGRARYYNKRGELTSKGKKAFVNPETNELTDRGKALNEHYRKSLMTKAIQNKEDAYTFAKMNKDALKHPETETDVELFKLWKKK